MFWSFQWGQAGMMRAGGKRILSIPVSLFIGFQAAILPWFTFNSNREYTWVLIPSSLYLSWLLSAFLKKIKVKHGDVFLLIHLMITTLYMPGIFSAYNSYAVISISLTLIHLFIEYLTREKSKRSKNPIPAKIYRRKNKVIQS